jgi:hypothetical protein
VPGVVTSLVTFTKVGTCTGVGQPFLESWDPLTLTVSVSAPLNIVPEDTLNISSKLASGVVDQYCAQGLCNNPNVVGDGKQLVANAFVTVGVDVSTAIANGPINFTAQIVPGQNWAGSVTGSVIVPTPTDIIYQATGPSGFTRIPVGVNTATLAGLPAGTYTALLVITPSPETPALPTSASTACGWGLSGTPPQPVQLANFPTVPVGSGTASSACVPIVINILQGVTTNIATLVFGTQTTTPEQTRVPVSNPTTTAFNFIATYQANAVYGTPLPAANVFYVGTGSTLTSAIGGTVSGTVPAGGLFDIPVQINPVGLPTGVYSGQLLISNTSAPTGPTAQTTAPIIVYVGPHAGEDTPSGNGLGLMLPVDLPPAATGVQNVAPGTPGSYPLIVTVPSGVGPNGFNQIANPTVVEVTGLNNTLNTSFSVSAPSVSGFPAGSVTFTNPGAAFGAAPGTCGTTYSQFSNLSFGRTPLGPTCAWSLWVDATSLNSTNTTPQAVCGTNGVGIAGTITFAASGGSFPFSSLVVPLTVCVTDSPSLVLGMPNTFPNPTYGPYSSFGLNTAIAQPSNLIPGFPQSIVDMVLAQGSGNSLTTATAAPIILTTSAGNSNPVCKILDLRTTGGVIPNVDIAPISASTPWLTVQPLSSSIQGAAVFMGPGPTAGSAPNTLRFNSLGNGIVFQFPNGGICILGGASSCGSTTGLGIPGNPPFAAGLVNIVPDFQTFAICVNTDPVGNATGNFSGTVTIGGNGVGTISVPVTMQVGQGGSTGDLFPQIGVFRPPTPVGGALGFFIVNKAQNYVFTGPPNDKTYQFGLAGDSPVAGDWDGTGVIRLGVFRCPAPGAGVCTWYLDQNNNGVWDGIAGGDIAFQFGLPGDIPVVGDWTGTGISKVGVMRCPAVGQPGVCTWILDAQNTRQPNSASFVIDSYGLPGDLPAVGNWAASGGSHPTDQIGVFRNGLWIVNSSASGFWSPSDTQYSYGLPGDVPVTGNWQNAANKRIGVFRCPAGAPGSATCTWILNTSGSGVFSATDLVTSYGLVGDKPVVGFWTLP